MSGELSLSRNAKLYVTTVDVSAGAAALTACNSTNTWRIPILDGFSFTQEPTQQEIGVSEAGDTPVRGQQVFNTALEPVNWSLSTYMRPRAPLGGGTAVGDAIERIFWEGLAGRRTGNPITSETSGHATTVSADTTPFADTYMRVDFEESQTNELLTLGLLFELGGSFYILDTAVVDTAEIDFSIDSIATINWTGFANGIRRVDVPGTWEGAVLGVDSGELDVGSGQYVEIPAGDVACIRNKLSTLILEDNEDVWNGGNPSENIALTGGSLTISNNIEYLTPEALGVLNRPCGHLTGTRTISGNITAYLKLGASYTAGLMEHISQATTADPFDFHLTINVGGSPSARPIIKLEMPHTHLGIPNPQIEDVIQVDIAFAALPYNEGTSAFDFQENNELEITYYPAV